MKKNILICLLLCLALPVFSQGKNYSYQQTMAAMKCRMIKALGGVIYINDKRVDTYDFVEFTLVYGGKESGYSSEDFMFLMPDDPDKWNRKGYPTFMGTPYVTKKEDTSVRGLKTMLYLFKADSWNVGVTMSENVNPVSDNIFNIRVGDKSVGMCIVKCDFYDISTGSERLVLKDYEPMSYHYVNGNLLRVFLDNMQKYYYR